MSTEPYIQFGNVRISPSTLLAASVPPVPPPAKRRRTWIQKWAEIRLEIVALEKTVKDAQRRLKTLRRREEKAWTKQDQTPKHKETT